MKDQNIYRTRFAPSPTGHLHVGGARTALFCKAWAKANNGLFVIRIEDTDQARSTKEAEKSILEDLLWLGLDWDEGPTLNDNKVCGGGDFGPYRQSDRKEKYTEVIKKLVENGFAYYAFETSEELSLARSQARAEKRPYKYNRAALNLSNEEILKNIEDGIPYVVRFKVPSIGTVVVKDSVLGSVEVKEEEIEDFVIQKADGFPTYHLAVVVDDFDMKITHVIRGSEHLANTIKHVLLQDALGYERPQFAHLPLIMNPDGSKMSKRDRDKALRKGLQINNANSVPIIKDNPLVPEDIFSDWIKDKHSQLNLDYQDILASHFSIKLPEIAVEDFRASGYLPEVLINYLGLLGWSAEDGREKFDLSFLENNFVLNRIGKSAARFDRDKLLSFHLDYIQSLSEKDFCRLLKKWCKRYNSRFSNFEECKFSLFAKCTKERSKTLADPSEICSFLVQRDEDIIYEQSKSVKKAMIKGDTNGFDVLNICSKFFQSVDSWTLENLILVLEEIISETQSSNLGKIAQPLRVALTGGTISPPIAETLVLLGQEQSINRINRCLMEHPLKKEICK